MNLNKFNIGDTVHVSVRVVGVTLHEDGSVSYTVEYADTNDMSSRIYGIPESFVSKVF